MQEEKEKIKQIFKKESRSLNDKKLNPTKSDTVQAPPAIIWDDNDN
ncbi:MAG: hypothetical protein HYZ42_06985 [Bacteroidetes bacterium]|nr:hypothetical protein [Bacteroidota bacterium]